MLTDLSTMTVIGNMKISTEYLFFEHGYFMFKSQDFWEGVHMGTEG